MYLSDRDLKYAIETGQLIVDPTPEEYGATSIDLHLDKIEEAKVWNVERFKDRQSETGNDPWLRVGKYRYSDFSKESCQDIPEDSEQLVYRNGNQVILKPHGFFLWQTQEEVGTPEEDPRFICFINGRSSTARSGLLVHMTAPTIHAGWYGQITLEIANLGPFYLCLVEGDPISQITVSTISSPPLLQRKRGGIAIGQRKVSGNAS